MTTKGAKDNSLIRRIKSILSPYQKQYYRLLTLGTIWNRFEVPPRNHHSTPWPTLNPQIGEPLQWLKYHESTVKKQ